MWPVEGNPEQSGLLSDKLRCWTRPLAGTGPEVHCGHTGQTGIVAQLEIPSLGRGVSHLTAQKENSWQIHGGAFHQKPRAWVRNDIPRGRVTKAEMCLLGTLFLTEEQDPGQKAPVKSLEVAGISTKTLENVGAGRPPPQEHYLAGV